MEGGESPDKPFEVAPFFEVKKERPKPKPKPGTKTKTEAKAPAEAKAGTKTRTKAKAKATAKASRAARPPVSPLVVVAGRPALRGLFAAGGGDDRVRRRHRRP
jgi:hypothetical protein